MCSPACGLLYFSLAGLLKGHPAECQTEIQENVKARKFQRTMMRTDVVKVKIKWVSFRQNIPSGLWEVLLCQTCIRVFSDDGSSVWQQIN